MANPNDQEPRDVSIRSPRRNEGRPMAPETLMSAAMFQSAPPAETRGDGDKVKILLGDTQVSIRSPRRNEGRHSLRGQATNSWGFQSAPPAETRGDVPSTLTWVVGWEFQSAPPAETRGDWGRLKPCARTGCFNPLPPPKRGETLDAAQALPPFWSFNPLPPPKRGETTMDRAIAQSCELFQSAPPAETRGDALAAVGWRVESGFNPLPPPKRGETAHLRPHPGVQRVSIRSPRRNEGRHTLKFTPPLKITFQSAPPAETRGDVSARRCPPNRCCFNPLPPPKRGETLRVIPNLLLWFSFNPLPPPKRGETHLPWGASVAVEVSIRSPRRNEGRP